MPQRRIKYAYVAGLAAAIVTFIVSGGHATPYNNFVLLAQALLGGHTWIDWPGAYIDALPFTDGKYYVIEAPLPAVLLMPFVAIFGSANQTTLSIVLAGVAIGAAWELGERYGLRPAVNAWICGFLLAGTDLLWAAMLGDVWFIAHVSSVCFTMLALVELAGKRRGWVVGLWAACAFESRFSLVAAVPVYAYLLLSDPERPFKLDPNWRKTLIALAAVLVPVAALWVLYNYARWGTWSDIGYTAWYHQDQAGEPTGSPFQFKYLPMQLYSFFVQGPTQLQGYPGDAPGDHRRRADVDVARARARILRAQTRAPGRRTLGRRAARRVSRLYLLRERLRAVRHAPRARFRTVPRRPHHARLSRTHPAMGLRPPNLVDARRTMGLLVLERLRPGVTAFVTSERKRT